jgi:hypothetical protein
LRRNFIFEIDVPPRAVFFAAIAGTTRFTLPKEGKFIVVVAGRNLIRRRNSDCL